MKKIIYKTLSPKDEIPDLVIVPIQTHSDNIIEIKTGKENLENCDGIWTFITPPSPLLTQEGEIKHFLLGIKTADCAPIVFIDDEKFGVIHAGWRGLCGNIIENMLEIFLKKNSKNKNLKIWVGPILPKFEIQKDFCYNLIYQKFGETFFEEKNNNIYFNFKKALASLLPKAEFDNRNTLEDENLASFRENKTLERNITIVGEICD